MEYNGIWWNIMEAPMYFKDQVCGLNSWIAVVVVVMTGRDRERNANPSTQGSTITNINTCN